LANQLRGLLEQSWPGAAAVFADVDSPIALEFLERYPTPASAAALGEKRVAAFLAKNAYCGRRTPKELLERLRAAPAGLNGELDARSDGAECACTRRGARTQGIPSARTRCERLHAHVPLSHAAGVNRTSGIQRRVADYMTSPVVTIADSQGVVVADELMRQAGISALVVLRGGGPPGLISRTDLLAVATGGARRSGSPMALSLPAKTVGEICTPFVVDVSPDETIANAAAWMTAQRVHRLAVRRAGELLGILSTKDVMAAVREARLAEPISSYMSAPLVSVASTDPLESALARLAEAHVTALVVTEGSVPIGLFTQVEALESRHLPGSTWVEEAMSESLLCLPHDTPMFRAAGFALSTRARRVLAVEQHHARGFLSGMDFVRAAMGPPEDREARVAAT
jgi:predicted transcriptional regulator